MNHDDPRFSASDKSDSRMERLLRVLELFSERRLTWTAEEITESLEVSLPTGYRYIKMLVAAGLLQRVAESRYTLGPRIIVMDHYIRMADPVLQHGQPFMKELVERTGLDCVVTGLYGTQVLDTHREYGNQPVSLSFGRGRPRSLFAGAAPKVILSCFSTGALHKVFDAHAGDIAAAGLPTDWKAFRRHFAAIRKAGYYVSEGEVDPDASGIGAPMQKADGTVLGAITLVATTQRMALIDHSKVIPLVIRAAHDITARIP